MAQQKDDLLARLFALRAGISAISVETTHVKSNENAISVEKQKLSFIYEQLHEIDNQTQNIKNQLESTKKLYDLKLNSRDKDIEEKTKSKCKGAEYKLKTIIACGLALFFSIPMIILLAISTLENVVMPIIILFVGILLFIGAIIRYNIKVKKVRDKYTSDVDSEINEYSQSIESANITLATCENNRKEWQQRIKEAEQQRDCNIATYNDSIAAHVEIAMSYNSVLEDHFSPLLNPSDWENIDLCIYYLQTGRAESIKECLQLVDRQRQTNEIVNAVQQASDRICNEIHSGFTALGKTMIKCFNSVSAQLESISSQIANEHNEVINALNRINDSNSAILSATQLNNALLAKANMSSEQLANDLHYIKQYA